MNEEIKKWLEGPQDYDQGLVLLSKYSKNRNMRNMLSRTHKPDKLERELRKLANLKPKPAKKKPAKPEKQEQTQEKTFTKVVHEKSIDYDALPASMKKVYDHIKQLYKERASYHEKAKLLTKQGAEGNTIGNLVQKVKETDAAIRDNWEKIDNYNPEQEKQKDQKQEAPITYQRVSANRKYISSNKSKLKKDPEKWRDKIQKRVDELLQAGETFKPEIKEELKSCGIRM